VSEGATCLVSATRCSSGRNTLCNIPLCRRLLGYVHPCQFGTIWKRLFVRWTYCNWHAVATEWEHCRSP